MLTPSIRSLAGLTVTVLIVAAGIVPRPAAACPFCSAAQTTLSEDIKSNDATVVARLTRRPDDASAGSNLDDNKAQFEIVKVLKGEKLLGDNRKIEVLYFGQQPVGSMFLIYGIDPMKISWATPTPLSEAAVKYVEQLPGLPESGAERLKFFQEYLENTDPLLAGDSYDEFAKAPYADVQGLREAMHHDQLVAWIKDPKLTASRRRLYLTMLGVCGSAADVPMLEELIRSEDRQMRLSLDALIACYLSLKGPEGMPLVEDLFLKKADPNSDKPEYVDTYAAIMALRFHGQELDIVPKDRILQALRYMLDRPQLADLVIPDLARWQDWSVMDRLVQMFKDAKEDTIWVRVPVVNYLRACPLPEAKAHIEDLRKIDEEAVKRASQFFPLPGASKPPPGATRPEDKVPAAKADSPAKDETTVAEPTAVRPASLIETKSNGAGEEVASALIESAATSAPGTVRLASTSNAPRVEPPARLPPAATAPITTQSKAAAAPPTRSDPQVASVPRLARSPAVATGDAGQTSPWWVMLIGLGATGGVTLLMATILRSQPAPRAWRR